MIELEERLRSALADLADEVPPSPNPMAEQRRRQAGGTRPARRRPMLAAAAAAVVLAVAVIPAAVTRDAQPGVGNGGPGGRPGVEPRHLDPAPDGPYLTITDGPFPIGEFTEAGRRWSVLAFLERHPAGSSWAHRACVVAVPPGATPNDPNRHPGSTGCAALSDWPVGQPPAKVHTRALLHSDTPGGGPLPGLLLFITAPEVSRLDVRGAYGEPARVTELARTADIVMSVADFGTTSAGFGYTARDAAGAVLEQAIS